MLIHPESNPVRDQILDCQIEYHQLLYTTRTLHQACGVHKSHIIMGKQPKVKLIRKKTPKERVTNGEEHKDHTVENFWQYVAFIDEAHFGPG